MAENYPVNLTIDYPDRKLNRLTTFFRVFMLIPIYIIYLLLMNISYNSSGASQTGGFVLAGIGFIFLPVLLMLLFRKKYPRWWYDWNFNFTGFVYRLNVYAYLLTDIYPSTDEEQNVHLELSYPDAAELSRGLPLVKWLLAIPHYIILACLGIAAFVVTIIAWFAILFKGRYPEGIFNFVSGVLRWNVRVLAYSILLVTDKYPPFSLEA